MVRISSGTPAKLNEVLVVLLSPSRKIWARIKLGPLPYKSFPIRQSSYNSIVYSRDIERVVKCYEKYGHSSSTS
jgi:hypothetical protein